MSLTDLPERLRVLESVDLADLLADVRNDVHRLNDMGEESSAGRCLGYWEAAIGHEVLKVAAGLTALSTVEGHRSAVREFRHSQEYRRAALNRIHAAVLAGRHEEYRRWRIIARGYGARIRAFALDRLRVARVVAARFELDSAAGALPLDHYPVLAANLDARKERLDDEHAEIGPWRSLAGLDRSMNIVQEVERLEDTRRALATRVSEALTELDDNDFQLKRRHTTSLRRWVLVAQLLEINQRLEARACSEYLETVNARVKRLDGQLGELRALLVRRRMERSDDGHEQ